MSINATVQHSTVHYNVVWYNVAQFGAVQCMQLYTADPH
jgi:hypothetical protein